MSCCVDRWTTTNITSNRWFALARACAAIGEGRAEIAIGLLRDAGLVAHDLELQEEHAPVQILEHATASLRAMTGPRVLHFADDGSGFQLGDCRFDLARREALRRILTTLIYAESPLSTASLVAAGWPNERIERRAGHGRVRVAIAALRRGGLSAVLLRDSRGYSLSPDLEIRIVPRSTLSG